MLEPQKSFDGNSNDRANRAKFLIIIFTFLFAILVLRLFFIQVVNGDENLYRAVKNRVRLKKTTAERGLIFDRNSVVIARNRPSYRVEVIPGNITLPPVLENLQNLFPIDDKKNRNIISKAVSKARHNYFKPTPIISNLDPLKVKKILSNSENYPGVSVSNNGDLFITHYKKKTDFIKNNLLKITKNNGSPLFDTLQLDNILFRASHKSSKPTIIKDDISIESVAIIEEHYNQLPGIIVVEELRREYPYGKSMFHLLGYTDEISSAEFKRLEEFGYYDKDKVGQSGIEKQYDSLLHGSNGYYYREVNTYGRETGKVTDKPHLKAKAGKNIYLTIDADLQQYLYSLFPDSIIGSFIAIDPRNGEILSMYSNPTVDPNIFSLASNIRKKEWAVVATDPKRPLSNRVIGGLYQPGSTFKLLTALAALENGIKPDDLMDQPCVSSGFRLGRGVSRCWSRWGHGHLSMYDAIKTSCNIYFYQVGLELGDTTMVKFSEMFGLGIKTGVDLPWEKSGWGSGKKAYNKKHKKKKGWQWTRGILLNMAIGQAQIYTPIQLAVMVGAIGNNGQRYKPHLLSEIRNSDSTVVFQNSNNEAYKIELQDSSLLHIKEGMRRVISEKHGTGARASVPYIQVGGKTGSSENPHGSTTHALFVGVAPLDNPIIAVAVVLENAGHGGAVAAPIAGKYLRYFFENNREGKKLVEISKMKEKSK